MAALVKVGGFANDGERRVAAELAREVPAPSIVVANLFLPIVGDTVEIDLLVVRPTGVVVVEVKDWWGTVRFENGHCTKDGQRRDDPRVLLSRKTKILHSMLGRLAPVPNVRIVTAPMLVFARDETRIMGDVDQSTPVVTIGHAAALLNQGRLGPYVQTHTMTPQDVLAVAEALAGKHEAQHAVRLGSYVRGPRLAGTPHEEYRGAEATQPDQPVRLKRVALDDLASHAERAEQKRLALRDVEALRALQRLRLRELPLVYSVFEDPDDDAALWTAYEAVEGRPLVDAGLTPRDAITALTKAARALGACHRAGVLHRALSPECVILGSDGEPRLLHFDYARVLGKATIAKGPTAAAIRGMLRAAPEVRADPSGASIASDVYAFGVIAMEALLGERLAPEDDPRRVARRLKREAARVVLRALESDPRARYADLEAMADDLARARS